MSEEHEIVAAEYVLGTLHADERTLFVSVLAHDGSARAAVADWEKRLAPLGVAVPEIAPPQRVWDRIENALPPHGEALTAPPFSFFDDVQGNSPAMATLRRSLNRWRAAALAAATLAAVLAIFVVDRELVNRQSALSSYVAVVDRSGDQPAFIVHVDLGSGDMYVRPIAVQAPAGKSLELWYIDEGKAPRAMGVVSGNAVRMPLPAGLSLDHGTFAVTVEPVGGSPSGHPTGPVVCTGKLIRE